MANVLVLGGGFGGVVAAESLAKRLGPEHQITLVSRSSRFIFWPALVRLAFGKCEPADISYDLREAMLDRRIRFIEGEVARIEPEERRALIARGEVAGELSYDYLVFALGRRLATERVTGFYEHAHHLLTVDAALKFGEAVRAFKSGRAVIGYCEDARLVVPVYETAFALARLLEESGARRNSKLFIVSPERPGESFGGALMASAMRDALDAHDIELLTDFPVQKINAGSIKTADNRYLTYDLLMLIPPFQGASAATGTHLTDADGYLRVDHHMRVEGAERVYAAGDCVNFPGPKMGHMAVRQGEVVAANLAAEIEGHGPIATYEHELMLIVDEGGPDSIYLHQPLWDEGAASVRHGRFWSWAKRVHEKYWMRKSGTSS